MVAALGLFSGSAFAADHEHGSHGSHATAPAELCTGFGPQTPRDIGSKGGENKVVIRMAPPASDMKLCNIHFHENAEHKSSDFSIFAGEGHEGYGSGYQCNISKKLNAAEMAWQGDGVCKSAHGDLKPGDTIEVHWVHTTCDVPGGKGLGSCVSAKCANPELRVETQVFTLVAEGGLDFNKLQSADGYRQAGQVHWFHNRAKVQRKRLLRVSGDLERASEVRQGEHQFGWRMVQGQQV